MLSAHCPPPKCVAMISLAGKSALITGGSRGIGLAIAQRFAAAGVSCLLLARDAGTLRAACGSLASLSPPPNGPNPNRTPHPHQQPPWPHDFLAGDVGHQDTWREVEKLLLSRHLHVLVNAAGISQASLLVRTGLDEVDCILQTNLRATVLACKTASKHMLRRPRSERAHCSIINLSSVLAMRGGTGAAVYAASKAAVIGLTSALSGELGRSQIRVNALVPGYIETQMTEKLDAPADQVPLGRMGKPEEVADAAWFLATNSYANNCVLILDGGLSAAAASWNSRP